MADESERNVLCEAAQLLAKAAALLTETGKFKQSWLTKRVFNAKTGIYFWKSEMWTHRFVCLAYKNQIHAPS